MRMVIIGTIGLKELYSSFVQPAWMQNAADWSIDLKFMQEFWAMLMSGMKLKE